jgi:hypothetical protein
MAAARGFYIANHLFVDDNGALWQYVDNPGLQGLGDLDGVWEQVGEYFKPIVQAVGPAIATRIAGRAAEPAYVAPPAGGIQVGATSQGLFGGIDTTTLLLIGGLGIGAVMLMRK